MQLHQLLPQGLATSLLLIPYPHRLCDICVFFSFRLLLKDLALPLCLYLLFRIFLILPL